MGAMLATSSRARSTGGRTPVPARVVGAAGVGGLSDVVDQPHHHGGHQGLAVGRRGDVDGVRRAHEPARDRNRGRRWPPGPGRSGTRSARPRRSTRCRSAPARRWRRCRRAGSGPARWTGPARRPGSAAPGRAWRRSTQVRRVRMSAPSRAAACSSGASSAWARSVQWEPSLVGRRRWPTRPHLDQRPGHGRAPDPCACTTAAATTAAGGSRSIGATDPVGSNRRHRPSRDRAADGGVEHVRFGRGGHDRTVARHHVGDDQRRRLPRARRTEDHHRLLGSDEAPTAFAVAEIRRRARRRRTRPARRESARMARCGALRRKNFSCDVASRHRLVRRRTSDGGRCRSAMAATESPCRIILANKRFSVHGVSTVANVAHVGRRHRSPTAATTCRRARRAS